MSKKLKQIGLGTTNVALKQRLILPTTNDDPLAAVAFDMKYHLSCFRKQERATIAESSKISTMDITVSSADIVNADLISYVKNKLVENEEACELLDMNEIQKIYVEMLEKLEIDLQTPKNYKPFFKKNS